MEKEKKFEIAKGVTKCACCWSVSYVLGKVLGAFMPANMKLAGKVVYMVGACALSWITTDLIEKWVDNNFEEYTEEAKELKDILNNIAKKSDENEKVIVLNQ